MKAAAPMRGMICPPCGRDASTAAAKYPEYPIFVIRGMVNAPVVTTLAGALPLIIPKRPLAKIETFAGPPGFWPATLMEKLLKSTDSPVAFKKDPNKINKKMYVLETPRGCRYSSELVYI